MVGRRALGVPVIVLMGALAAAVLAAQEPVEIEIEGFDYADAAALAAAWGPVHHESPPPEPVTGPDGRPAARFRLPFAALNDRRVAWDLWRSADLSDADRILVRMRTDDPGAVVCVLYARSGNGWHRFPSVGVGREWTTAVFRFDRAADEGRPGGREGFGGVRLCFLPGARRDTSVEVAWIRAAGGWTPQEIGRISRFANIEEARGHIVTNVRPERRAAAETCIGEALDLRAEILNRGVAAGPEVDAKALTCRELMARAYAMVQESRPGELRGFWCHYGSGPVIEGRRASWGKAIPMLTSGGLNAIFPNMLFSGVAYFPSRVVPVHPIVEQEGDQLAACIAAARAHGVQVHVWKVCWEVGWQGARDAHEPFEREGRLQVDRFGRTRRALCPSNPVNRRYELDAILEAAEYDVDGIHLDYIRYQDANVCYCDGCRERFGAASGRPVADWPAEVAAGGARAAEYAAFREEQITSFVREVRRALKETKPGLKLSAAVWEPAPSALRVAQDWPAWVDEGLLDFVCPMIYTEDAAYFEATLAEIMRRVGGRVDVCPGLKVVMGSRPEGRPPLDVTVDQIAGARALSVSGFVLFELREFQQTHLMPYLRAGLTAEP
ncbi:MAG: family 10 glycosylhydrolase [Candidatus Brocadiaceae bacterium]|nr:family 10 glycosylhydrolase [Candidatus Brocadiaceae bacterium]